MSNELPRFSRYLRKNTKLELPRHLPNSNNLQLFPSNATATSNDTNNSSTSAASWKELKIFMQKNCSTKWQKINELLQKLWINTRNFIGFCFKKNRFSVNNN